MENEETLETSTVVRNTTDFVEDLIDQLLAHSVVPTGVVVGRILLASDHLFGVKERAIGAGADFIDDIGLEIAVDGTRDVFAIAYEVVVSVYAEC